MEITGWQANTVRAARSGLRKKGWLRHSFLVSAQESIASVANPFVRQAPWLQNCNHKVASLTFSLAKRQSCSQQTGLFR